MGYFLMMFWMFREQSGALKKEDGVMEEGTCTICVFIVFLVFLKFIFKQLQRNEVRLSVPKRKVDDGALTEEVPVFRPV